MKLSATSLDIEFNHAFAHSAARRTKTQAFIVKAELADNIIGYGEGCPRLYVTAETLDTARAFFTQHHAQFCQLTDLPTLRHWVATAKDLLDKNPAAWCAVECAILDALARAQAVSLEKYLALKRLAGPFRYTAVLGADDWPTFVRLLTRYQQLQLGDFKLKISGDRDLDHKKLQHLHAHGYRVRVDANNKWPSATAAIDYLSALDCRLFALEEPVGAGDFTQLRQVAANLKLPLIVDESFLGVDQFADIAPDPQRWLINLRVSKMGGVLRALDVAAQANQLGVKLIVGAHVGETSLLTRAALSVANSYPDLVLAQEGAFGTYLLRKDCTDTPIMFGQHGELSSQLFADKPGFGLDYSSDFGVGINQRFYRF